MRYQDYDALRQSMALASDHFMITGSYVMELWSPEETRIKHQFIWSEIYQTWYLQAPQIGYFFEYHDSCFNMGNRYVDDTIYSLDVLRYYLDHATIYPKLKEALEVLYEGGRSLDLDKDHLGIRQTREEFEACLDLHLPASVRGSVSRMKIHTDHYLYTLADDWVATRCGVSLSTPIDTHPSLNLKHVYMPYAKVFMKESEIVTPDVSLDVSRQIAVWSRSVQSFYQIVGVNDYAFVPVEVSYDD